MAVVDTKLMTQADYSRHRECSREAVRKAVDAQRITTFGPDKLIDATLADAQWARNTRARVKSSGASDTDVTVIPPSTPGEQREKYDDVRLRREQAEARLSELTLEEKTRSLVKLSEVRSAMAGKVAAMREALMQIPSRLVPVLAAESDPVKIHAALELELVQALAFVSGAID